MLDIRTIHRIPARAVLTAVLALLLGAAFHLSAQTVAPGAPPAEDIRGPKPLVEIPPVSYTHLTLPTIYSV